MNSTQKDTFNATGEVPLTAFGSVTAKDCTSLIQGAIDWVQGNGGGILRLPRGPVSFARSIFYRVDVPIMTRGMGARRADKVGGSMLVFTGRDGSDAIIVRPSDNPAGVYACEFSDFSLNGGTPDQITGGDRNDRTKTPMHNANGLVLDRAHHVTVRNLLISGFDNSAMLVDNTYYGTIEHMHLVANGVGLECRGPNATNFRDIITHWNTTGMLNPIQVDGGCAEGNFGYGIRFTGAAAYARASLRNQYFEANGTPATAQLFAEQGNIYLELCGHTTFNNVDPPVRCLAGPGIVELAVSGALEMRSVYDAAGHNAAPGLIDLPNAIIYDSTIPSTPSLVGQSFVCRPVEAVRLGDSISVPVVGK